MNDKEIIDPDFLGFDTDSKLKGLVDLRLGDYSLPGLAFDVTLPTRTNSTCQSSAQIPQIIYNVKKNKNSLF
jgi:hypothetical protein